MSTATSATSIAVPLMQRLGRHRALVFPIACIALVAVLLVPLPPALLDLLLVLNITLSVLLLVTAMHVQRPLEFAVLPSLLLAVTMFRLTLNVATTRLILTAGAPGEDPLLALDDAGQVVQAFASFVTSGSMAVGLIIFAIIFVIQFVVITKGATRISEVAARFTLDAMPGKQMAIDADLTAGVIDEHQARRRREEISQEADFYGSMDGASKFVRGDAIAGIIITFVNIAGGMYIGMVERGWDLKPTAEVFTKLTIGDGLVAQVPAFITALGCGMIITRSSTRAELGEQVVSQLFTNARPLWIAAIFLLCMSVTGLPAGPLIVLAGCCGGLAYVLGRNEKAKLRAQERRDEQEASGALQEPAPVEKLLEVEALELEVGRGLVRLVDVAKGGDLLDRVSRIRRRIAAELGLIIPPIRICDESRLEPSQYVLKVRGVEVARAELYPDQFLAIDDGASAAPMPHSTSTSDPASGRCAYWITEPQKPEAQRLGYTLLDAPAVLESHLSELIRAHSHVLLSRQEVRNLLDHLKRKSPALVEEVIGTQIKLGDLQKVLQNLLRRRIPIRDLETILETLSDHAGRTSDIEEMTACCRSALAPAIGKGPANLMVDAPGASQREDDPDFSKWRQSTTCMHLH